MANCSSAFGTIYIRVKGENKEDEKRLIQNLKSIFDKNAEIGYYETEITEFELGEDVEGVYGLATFIGTGRWTFFSNIENVYKWFEQMLEEDKWGTPELREKWAELDKHDWSLDYDFTDEECGLGVLYVMEATAEHKAGEKEITTTIHGECNYDYTPENLVELDVCGDIDEAREYCGIEDEDEESEKCD